MACFCSHLWQLEQIWCLCMLLLPLHTPADDEVQDPFAWKIKKGWKASDGTSHIGSSLSNIISHRPFPGVTHKRALQTG